MRPPACNYTRAAWFWWHQRATVAIPKSPELRRGWIHFVENAGYNEWADANNIVVLYPQARTANLGFANPQGCWDFWG